VYVPMPQDPLSGVETIVTSATVLFIWATISTLSFHPLGTGVLDDILMPSERSVNTISATDRMLITDSSLKDK
jgi:hypothetical protein